MSLYRLWAILRKEFRHIVRDKRTLFLVTLSPAIMLFAFAYLFALEVTNIKFGVWDLDHSATSRQLVASIASDGKFVQVASFDNYDHIRVALMSGTISLALVIPPDFEAHLYAGKPAPLQAIIDGTDSVTASASIAGVRERVTAFNNQVVVNDANASPEITLNMQAWFNRELTSTYSMVPGLIPIVLILPSLAITLAITREKELGSFEMLATTPIRGAEYLIGKLIPYIVFGLVSAAIALALALVWFQVPLRGSFVDLALFTLLYLFASLGLSLFISGFLVSQGTAMRIIMLVFFIPSFFLAGIILPVDIRSGVSQVVSFFLPATQFVQMTRGVFLKALGFSDLLEPARNLFIIGVVPLILSVLFFRKQVDY